MTHQLYLAANLVPQTLIYGHLQIVYEDSAGNLLENETTSPGFPYFFGNWAYPDFGRPHDNTTNTPGYGNSQDYAIVPLDLRPQQTAQYVWELVEEIYTWLSSGGFGLDYDIQQNSNSYVKTVLSVVGLDVGAYLAAVMPPDVSGFPGVGTNILQGAKTGGLFSGYDTPIPLTLAGTAGNDYIATGIGNDDLGGAAGNDTIYGAGGRDTLSGGSGIDSLFGGGGGDRLYGGNGNDTLFGGSQNDRLFGGGQNDRLFGNRGDDTLNGGAGNDTLNGGFGSDDFVFTGAFGNDVIVGFEALNGAEDINLAGVASITSFADLADPNTPHMTQVGVNVVIDDFAGNTITLVNVNLADLDASDFIF